MRKTNKLTAILVTAALSVALLAGCGSKQETAAAQETA